MRIDSYNLFKWFVLKFIMLSIAYESNIFSIKRLSPELAESIQLSYLLNKKKATIKSYKFTSDTERLEIIKQVIEEKFSLKEAAECHGLSYATVRNIVMLYMNEGRIYKKQKRKKIDEFDGSSKEGAKVL